MVEDNEHSELVVVIGRSMIGSPGGMTFELLGVKINFIYKLVIFNNNMSMNQKINNPYLKFGAVLVIIFGFASVLIQVAILYNQNLAEIKFGNLYSLFIGILLIVSGTYTLNKIAKKK
jgi:hypothetical protein